MCEQEEAQLWFDHLLSCPYSWPYTQNDHKVLAIIDQAFGDAPKPEHFTNYTHCDECEEHDNTLRNHTRENIRRSDLGNGGWDPITMSSPEGVDYYFPGLARYALQPDCHRDHDWYGSQLLSHLSWDGGNNRFLAWCSTKQQDAIFALLEHLSITRMDDIDMYGDAENLIIALNNWKQPD